MERSQAEAPQRFSGLRCPDSGSHNVQVSVETWFVFCKWKKCQFSWCNPGEYPPLYFSGWRCPCQHEVLWCLIFVHLYFPFKTSMSGGNMLNDFYDLCFYFQVIYYSFMPIGLDLVSHGYTTLQNATWELYVKRNRKWL